VPRRELPVRVPGRHNGEVILEGPALVLDVTKRCLRESRPTLGGQSPRCDPRVAPGRDDLDRSRDGFGMEVEAGHERILAEPPSSRDTNE
jgi:hypothetical protein